MEQSALQSPQVDCRRCNRVYTDQNPPLYLGCSKAHCICSVCIQEFINANTNQIVCAVDQENVDITNQTLANFRKNRRLLEVANEVQSRLVNKCRIHHNIDLDVFCLACRTKICRQCQRSDSHRNHKFDLLERMQAKIDTNFPELDKEVKKIENLKDLRRQILKQGEEDLLQQINDATEYACEVLRKKAEEAREDVKNVFATVINQQEPVEEAEENINAWKDETERLIRSLKDPGINQNKKYQVAAELYAQEILLGQIDFSSWQDKVLSQQESLRFSLRSLSIDKNEMLINAIENLPFCQFDPYHTLPPINEDKFEFGQYVLKRRGEISRLYVFYLYIF